MSTITIDSQAFAAIMNRLEFIEKSLKIMSTNNGFSKYVTEEEAQLMTDLSRRSLFDKRMAGILRWRSASGKKIKYLRKDIEAYLNGDNSVKPLQFQSQN